MDAEKIAIGLISGLLAGTIAIYTNYWRTKYTVKGQDFSKRVEELVKKIDSIEEISCDYWENNDAEKNKLYESKIIGRLAQVKTLINHLERNYKVPTIGEINDTIIAFRKVCSGGKFATSEK